MVFNGTAILSSVLNIVARLEHDRQETQASLEQQQMRAKDLKDGLDREDERRLDLLLESVQAGEFRYLESNMFHWFFSLLEHERCALDIRDLKWRIKFEGRRLQRQLEYQRKLSEKLLL